MEEVGKTDPMVILREKGWCRSSRKLLIGASTYDTTRDQNILPLHQIKTVDGEMKRWRMVSLNNKPGEDDGCRLNPDSSPGIYMNAVKEAQCCIVAKNRRKQDEVKHNPK